jgi:hypothetical protein
MQYYMHICCGSLREEYEGINSGIKRCKSSAYKQYEGLEA